VNLTEKELTILSAAHMQADLTLEQIQRETGIRSDTVRYTLKRLKERHLITLSPIIDVYRLGYQQYGLHLSLTPDRAERHAQFLKYLIEDERICYLSEPGGEYQVSITLCVKDTIAIEEFLESIANRFEGIFSQKLIAVRTAITDYPVKHLFGYGHTIQTLEWRSTRDLCSIDKLDHQILACISQQMTRSISEVARSVGAPYSTVEGRVRKLTERRVIVGYRYLLNNEALGIRSFLILVAVKGLHRSVKESFQQFCLEHRNVRYRVECLGGWDFELGVEGQDPRCASRVTQELQRLFGAHISQIRILPVFGYPKVVGYPFRSFVFASP
jgi:DNA-binding Lrp family transcriptional regulator